MRREPAEAGSGTGAADCSAAGSVKVNRAPSPGPSLSAQMRPPWASTMPLQMASPSPDPSTPERWSDREARENLRNSSGRSSAGMPLPWSATETATCTPSRTAVSRTGDPSGEYPAALESRLLNTWTMRSLSASTIGRSAARSTSRGFLASPLRNRPPASSTSRRRSAGSGSTGRAPVSMRATSSRSPMRPRICSVWSWMMRKNWRISAGSSRVDCAARVSADPLTDIRGDRSSWLTMARNSARSRSCSSRGVMSCRVTTKEATWPSSAWMGVPLIRTLTLRPSGTRRTISSARTVSPALRSSARGTL